MIRVILNLASYPQSAVRQILIAGIHDVQSFALLFTRPPLFKLAMQAAGVTALYLSFVIPAQAQTNDKYGVCKLLPKHTPQNNVVYQPGVDVYGNAVVPADLNAAPMGDVLNVIRVPLDVNLAQNVIALSSQGLQLEAPLGMLDVYQDGRILYNGQDWTAPVLTLCGESHKIVTTETIVETVVPEIPEAPVAPEIETLPNNLATDGNIERPEISKPTVADVEMPAVTAPEVEKLEASKVSMPATPIQPLIGTPKGASTTTSDIIKGQDHRDYNE